MKKSLSIYLAFTLLIALGSFFWGKAYGEKSQQEILRSKVVSWEEAGSNTGDWGEMRYFFEGDSFGAEKVLAAFAVIKPHQSLHPAHRHEEEEFLVLTEGSGMWHLNGKEFPAKKGDVLYVEPWAMHGLVNNSGEPLTFFVARWKSKGVASPPEPAGPHGQ
ncbi:MAG: cupin domain-containing protein [Candidatus Omnitrophota bacterium]